MAAWYTPTASKPEGVEDDARIIYVLQGHDLAEAYDHLAEEDGTEERWADLTSEEQERYINAADTGLGVSINWREIMETVIRQVKKNAERNG